MTELKIVDFAVILRNLVDLGKPEVSITEEKVLPLIQEIIVPETEYGSVIKQVSQTVCSLSKKDIVRFEFPVMEILDLPRVNFLSDSEVIDSFHERPHYQLSTYAALHVTGNLVANMHLRFTSNEGIPVSRVIEHIRINLRTLAIKLPECFVKHLDFEKKTADRYRFIHTDTETFLLGSLKDLTSEVLRPALIKCLKDNLDLDAPRSLSCLSSTLTQIYQTNPVCDSVEGFVSPTRFGNAMFGIGTMDRSFEERPTNLLREAFSHNLSNDEELGVYTFGLSDLMIFNHEFGEIMKMTSRKKQFKDPYTSVLYNTTHYSCLLEWVYLEKCIIERYNQLLSQAISNEKTTPEQMLALQKQSMHDLIVYKAGITPYPSREEFLEKARIAHRIPEFQEKLEKKRDLATDYIIQEYTLRTNKSIQLVNIFVAGTATFGLMDLALQISQIAPKHRIYWSSATTIVFLSAMMFLWLTMEVFRRRKL